MRKIPLLDDIDILLLRDLSKYPKITQTELANKLNLTQAAVSIRLRKLREKGTVRESVEVDPRCAGLTMMKVDMQTKKGSAVIEKFKRCPVVVNSYVTEGRSSLCMIIVGENRDFCNCMVAEHLEKDPDISSVTSEVIVENMAGFKTCMDADKKLDLPPCGDHPCSECSLYIGNGGECVGCPMTKFYKGSVWS